MKRVNSRQAMALIADREEFANHTKSLRGQKTRHPSTGRLSDEMKRRLHDEEPTYVVFSYATPIGWWSLKHGWTISTDKHSVTTSKHQHVLRSAVSA